MAVKFLGHYSINFDVRSLNSCKSDKNRQKVDLKMGYFVQVLCCEGRSGSGPTLRKVDFYVSTEGL